MHKKGARANHQLQDIDPALEAAKQVEFKRREKEMALKKSEMEEAIRMEEKKKKRNKNKQP